MAKVADPGEAITELPKIREEILQDDLEYQKALSGLRMAERKFSPLRTELLQSSSGWMSLSQEVRDAIKDQNKAEIEATNGGFQHMSAWVQSAGRQTRGRARPISDRAESSHSAAPGSPTESAAGQFTAGCHQRQLSQAFGQRARRLRLRGSVVAPAPAVCTRPVYGSECSR